MPHLNELHEKYSDRGLTILAVTDEPKGPTEEFVEQTGLAYPYAYDPGGKLARALGVTGIPHAFLVDPGGRIVWEGNPYSLSDSEIEQHLEGALPVPVWELDKDQKTVAAALRRHRFGEAIAAAEKLQDDTLAQAIEKVVTLRLEALEKAREEGDYLTAMEIGGKLAEEAKGLEAGDRAQAIVREIQKSADAKRVLKGQQKVRKLAEEPVRRRKDAEKILKSLAKIEKAYEGTAAAREAAELRGRLEELLDRLP